jgi:hypothetical protein
MLKDWKGVWGLGCPGFPVIGGGSKEMYVLGLRE